ncbi:TetR/AcrR family transcriptional regulator [Streptomyces pseudovenezuelae]|uniref:AcrR family transcriptional regulator n=1 Tax=Streptomyces pseudovenezuelae TaxID=67350 RepID=A0ABT6M0Q5_9ACTN|nr:TetR family transcriptional regulator [Streptomyces pseudovenezuelae]MDH6222132.1 AcrR family transcriptional regulator [Streptomyces pseudovenezuelae]
MHEGLRERKKREARQRISDVATRLFAQRGFEAVTVAEIAEAAGVAKATVTNYFPRKEDLLLDLQAEAERLLVDAIRARPPGQSVVEAVRALMHRLLAQQHPLSAVEPAMAWFGHLIAQSPALLSRAREQREYLESAVARQLTEETGDPVRADLVARLLLATATTAVVTPIRRLIAGEPATTIATDQPQVIDQAFDLLATGIRTFGSDT